MSYIDIAREELKVDEGVKPKVYMDSLGIPSIGVGRNLRDVGLSPYEINVLLENDLSGAEQTAKALFPSFDSLSDNRKAALLNMAFNMGQERLAGFHDFRAAIENQDFDKAATAMLASRWAKQVGKRAERLADHMRNG